jgi:pilus assembly protein FimV
MFTRNCCRVLLLALLSPAVTLALGLGEIHLHSALNAPLDADIDLLDATPEDVAGLQATLASRDSFTRYGLDYPAFLSSLSLTAAPGSDGHTVIHLSTVDPVNEPFATLLVEINWARGHIVREYTVLLDPPVFAGPSADAAAAAAPLAAPASGTTTRSGSIERPAASEPPSPPPPEAAAAAPAGAPAASASAPSETPGSASPPAVSTGHDVHSGETLSGIAAQAYGHADRTARERQLVAIYRANTQAFSGNMNLLRAGTHLSLPGDAEIEAVSPGEAVAEVQRQNAAWNESHGPSSASNGTTGSGQLRLVTPQESGPAAGAGASAGSGAGPAAGDTAAAARAAALQQQVTQLQSQLSDSQRLLQLKNEELARLQARAATSAAAPAPHPAAPAPAMPAAPAAPSPPAAAAPPAAPSAPPPAASAPPPPPSPSAAASVPKPAAAPVVHPVVEPESSMLDLAEEYWYVPAGLLAILIALLVVRAVRSRQEDAFDRSLGRMAEPGFDSPPPTKLRSDTIPVRALGGVRDEPSYKVEESGSHEAPNFDRVGVVGGGAGTRPVAVEDHVSTGAPVGIDQGDPLAEADFHMAYGLYDQAADLVQIAITREPARRDLKLKLLEVFFVWGNKDRFLQSARQLAGSREQALPGEWEKIVIMGRQIAPEDPLFANAGALAGAASGGVDLNLEGGQNRIDFDLHGEPVVSAGPSDPGVDLDLSAALGDSDPTGEARKISDSGVNFTLDDTGVTADATGTTREMPKTRRADSTGSTRLTGGGTADPEVPTVEQPQLRGVDNPTIRQKLDAATRTGMASADQTAELEIDDLGLDLGSLDTGVHESLDYPSADLSGHDAGGDARSTAHPQSDAPTLLAGLNDATRQLLARADAQRGETIVTPPPARPQTATGTWLFSDSDFAEVVAKGPAAGKARADAPTQIVTQIAPRPAMAQDADTAATSRLGALDSNGVDLDVGDFGDFSAASHGNAVDLDVGTAAADGEEGTYVRTQRISADDAPLPDLEPATMSEVGTKLDLARAYMDMGDPEGARSILSEVLTEGSVSQKQEARRLIEALPG